MKKLHSNHCQLLRKLFKDGYHRKKQQESKEQQECYAFKYSNDQILSKAKTTPICDFINKQQQKFLAHTIREPNYRHTKQLSFNTMESGSNLAQVLNETGMEIAQFAKMAVAREV